MPKGNNQKLKLFYLMHIMLEKTDEEHGITMPEIIKELEANEITAERKSIYDDFNMLTEHLGVEIEARRVGKYTYYHAIERPFELAELKLLVDAISSSKFITEKKTHELIKKLEKYASRYQAMKLHREVYISGRGKTTNEAIYYNVDAIHSAIGNNKQIQFQYFQWNVKKEKEFKKDGAKYQVSPWALLWEDEKYYMIGYDKEADSIKYYRVDKMLQIDVLEEDRLGKGHFEKFDIKTYSKKNFGMFAGTEQSVKMRFHNRLAGVVIDRFGHEVMMIPDGDDHFVIHVKVAVSEQFFGWVFGLGNGIQILGPEPVKEQMKKKLSEIKNMYE